MIAPPAWLWESEGGEAGPRPLLLFPAPSLLQGAAQDGAMRLLATTGWGW